MMCVAHAFQVKYSNRVNSIYIGCNFASALHYFYCTVKICCSITVIHLCRILISWQWVLWWKRLAVHCLKKVC